MRAMVSLLPRSRVDTALLKVAHPIAEVVARYGVELKRQGRAMVGRCIFHPDNGRPNLYGIWGLRVMAVLSMWHRRRRAGVCHTRREHRVPRGRRPTDRWKPGP